MVKFVSFQKRKKGPISYAPLFAASVRKARNIKEAKKGASLFQLVKAMEDQVQQAQEIYVPTPNKIVKVKQQSNYYLRSEPMMLVKSASSLISMKH